MVPPIRASRLVLLLVLLLRLLWVGSRRVMVMHDIIHIIHGLFSVLEFAPAGRREGGER